MLSMSGVRVKTHVLFLFILISAHVVFAVLLKITSPFTLVSLE